MKPIIILPPKTMSAKDIKILRDNDLCVVVAKDPSKVRFMDPIPAAASRTQIEDAAIKLSRCLLNGTWTGNAVLGRADFARFYVDMLIQGTPLDSMGTLKERCDGAYKSEKIKESRRLARLDAKAERQAMKKAEQKKKAAP